MASDTARRRVRHVEMDVIRAVCMIYIIGFWHLFSYSPHLPRDTSLPGTVTITDCCLGMFFFVSGFLLAEAYGGMSGGAAVVSFYRKRLLRLYLPYLAALLCFYAAGLCFVSARVLVDSAFLVAIFRNDAPQTLWFVNLIFVYYLAMPPLVCDGPRRYVAWAVVLLLLSGLLVVHRRSGAIDGRLFQYAPSYMLGLVVGLWPGLQTAFFSRRGAIATLVACAGVLAVDAARSSDMAMRTLGPPLLMPAACRRGTRVEGRGAGRSRRVGRRRVAALKTRPRRDTLG